jgi:hypothetical protein
MRAGRINSNGRDDVMPIKIKTATAGFEEERGGEEYALSTVKLTKATTAA